jgi:hypothetical protein
VQWVVGDYDDQKGRNYPGPVVDRDGPVIGRGGESRSVGVVGDENPCVGSAVVDPEWLAVVGGRGERCLVGPLPCYPAVGGRTRW